MSAKKAAAEQIKYAAAMEELEAILEEIENDSIDVDELATKVKRASALIKLCRERLTQTRLEIEQVVAELDGFEDEAGSDGDDA